MIITKSNMYFQPIIFWQSICSVKSWSGMGKEILALSYWCKLRQSIHSFSIHSSALLIFLTLIFGTYCAQDFVELSIKTPSFSYGSHSLLEYKNTQMVAMYDKILTKGCASPEDKTFNCLITSELTFPGWEVCWAEKVKRERVDSTQHVECRAQQQEDMWPAHGPESIVVRLWYRGTGRGSVY